MGLPLCERGGPPGGGGIGLPLNERGGPPAVADVSVAAGASSVGGAGLTAGADAVAVVGTAGAG
jgi:hypothetical protein